MIKTRKTLRLIVTLIVSLVMVFGLVMTVSAAPAAGSNTAEGQLATPVLREYFRIISGTNPNPHLAWDAVPGAVDYMVSAYDVDPDENPNAEPVRERLASAPVAPDISSRGGLAGAEAIESQRPALPADFEFDPENPAINVMSNFFTGDTGVTATGYDPAPPLPLGEFWFRVRALAENSDNNSELSNSVGPYRSFFIEASEALTIMGDGTPGEDWLLIDLRGFGYQAGTGPVPNLEFEQQGRLRDAVDGYRLDVMPLGSFPDVLMDFDRDLPVFVICLGGLRSRNAALTLAGFPELAADATGRELEDFEDFEPFTRVYDLGGINQWPYGRIFIAPPTAPISGGIPNPTPAPTIENNILTWGAIPDNVTSYSVFIFANADDTDPEDALESKTNIRGPGFRFPAGISPQPTSDPVTLDLSEFDIPQGYVRIQAIVDPTLNGTPTWGEDSPISEAIRFSTIAIGERPIDAVEHRTVDGTVFVPIRLTAYAYGATVEWDGVNLAVHVTSYYGDTVTVVHREIGGFNDNGTVWIPYEYALNLFEVELAPN